MLGRKPRSATDFEEAAARLDDAGDSLERSRSPEGQGEAEGQGQGQGEGSASAGPSRTVPVVGRESASSGIYGGAGTKRERFDDHKYLEESREAVDKAKSAVAVAMAKKKRKEAEKAKGKGKVGSGKGEGKVQAAKPVQAA